MKTIFLFLILALRLDAQLTSEESKVMSDFARRESLSEREVESIVAYHRDTMRERDAQAERIRYESGSSSSGGGSSASGVALIVAVIVGAFHEKINDWISSFKSESGHSRDNLSSHYGKSDSLSTEPSYLERLPLWLKQTGFIIAVTAAIFLIVILVVGIANGF